MERSYLEATHGPPSPPVWQTASSFTATTTMKEAVAQHAVSHEKEAVPYQHQHQLQHHHDHPSTPSWSPSGMAAVPYDVGGASTYYPPPRGGGFVRLALVSALVAVVAGVVGGVAGWRITEAKYRSSNGASSGPPAPAGTDGAGDRRDCPVVGATPNANAGAAAGTIRANSGLTVTGWRLQDSDDFQMRLFYQSPDDRLMTTSFHTLYGNWSSTRAVNVPSTLRAAPGAQLASITIWWDWEQPENRPGTPQWHVVYPTVSGRLHAYNWREAYPPSGLPDGVNARGHDVSRAAGIGAFWPYYHVQDDTGAVWEVEQSADRRLLDATKVPAAKDSPLLTLPVNRRHQGQEARLLFRSEQGRLSVLDRGSQGESTTYDIGGGIDLPQGASLAGFVTARSSSSAGFDDAVDTFVLWQDPAQRNTVPGGIRFVSQVSTTDSINNGAPTSWSAPGSDPVFADADVPTRLACLTAAVGKAVPRQKLVMLSGRKDMNRCFFQAAGGKLRQVWYDGTKWVNLGFVPLP